MLPLLFTLLSSPAAALEVRLGGSVFADESAGLITHIPRLGVHASASGLVGGEHHGLLVDLRFQQFSAYGNWERFPALGLAWSMGWGDHPIRPYHNLGGVLAFTGVMDTALAPVLPLATLEGGVEIQQERLWVRAGLQGFFAPAPALGGGPRLTVGTTF